MQGVSSNAIKPYSKSSLKEHVFEVLLRAIRKAQGAPKGIDHGRMRKKIEAIGTKRISRNKQANQVCATEQGSSS
jgi:hypothetical protein